jgi:hypothetical protein
MKMITSIMAIMTLVIVLPVIAQEKGKTAPAPATDKTVTGAATDKPTVESAEDVLNDQIYKEIIIEDFENTVWTNKDISVRETKDQKSELQIRNQYPAPANTSKKYAGVKIYGRNGDYVTIKPPKPLIIKDHSQSISMWIYGKNFSGELFMTIKDAEGQAKKITFGKLNFLGWRKLTVKIEKTIAQEDKYLAQPRQIEIINLIYNPGNSGRLPEWSYFYIDDITAKIREKYVDKQSDEW